MPRVGLFLTVKDFVNGFQLLFVSAPVYLFAGKDLPRVVAAATLSDPFTGSFLTTIIAATITIIVVIVVIISQNSIPYSLFL